jgi:hypothetical protein
MREVTLRSPTVLKPIVSSAQQRNGGSVTATWKDPCVITCLTKVGGVRVAAAIVLVAVTAACGPVDGSGAARTVGSAGDAEDGGRSQAAADRGTRAGASAPTNSVAPTTAVPPVPSTPPVPVVPGAEAIGSTSAPTTATQAAAGSGRPIGPATASATSSAGSSGAGSAGPSTTASSRAAGAPAGLLTNRTSSFTAAGHTADYRVFAEGIDTSHPVSLLVYADGTGEYGLQNPTSSYAIGGSGGLAAVARAHNMVLLTPFSPNRSCRCWEQGDAVGYSHYLAALISQLQAQYGAGELWFAGYSSGAQAATRFLFPVHPELWSGGGGVIAIGGGGPPAGRSAAVPREVRDGVVLRWDTGALDTGSGGGFNALSGPYGAQVGERWYAGQGFDTRLVVPSGVGHDRSGEFGGIVAGFLG